MKKSNKQKAREVVEHVSFGGKDVAMIPISKIRRNSWNPNRMDPEMLEKLKGSITEYGLSIPVIVRSVTSGWEIVDGEHRFETCKALGHKEVMCVDLGNIDDQKAKKFTIIANELRGSSDPNDLAKLIADLASRETVEDLARILPHSQVELESMISAMAPYELPTDVQDTSDGDPVNLSPPALAGLGKDIRVQLGPVKGTVPDKVFRALLEEWNNSVQHVGTKNVELVVADLTDRLHASRRPERVVTPATAENASEGRLDGANGTPSAPDKARKPRKADAV